MGGEAVRSVREGEILGIAGGHLAIAVWIVTPIHDYHNGIDFDSSVYLSKVTIMDKTIAFKLLHYFTGGNWRRIDVTRY